MTLRSECSAPVKAAKHKLKPQGLRFSVAPKLPINYGMDAARNLIPKCWFDQDKCRHGIEALQQYRTEYDERLRTLRPTRHCMTGRAMQSMPLATGRSKVPNKLR